MKDPYVLENGVLINKLGLSDNDILRQAEADIGFLKLINVDAVDIRAFDTNVIKQIHKHIFGEIYDWAGEYRTVPLYKTERVIPGISITYSDPKNIERDLKQRLNELNSIAWQNLSTHKIAELFAREIALIWRVHPFRDGNTRTMLSFAFLYAKEHGFPFDMETFTRQLNREYTEDGRITRYSVRDKFVLASLDDKDYPEVIHLAGVFEKAIEKQKEETSQNRRNTI